MAARYLVRQSVFAKTAEQSSEVIKEHLDEAVESASGLSVDDDGSISIDIGNLPKLPPIETQG